MKVIKTIKKKEMIKKMIKRVLKPVVQELLNEQNKISQEEFLSSLQDGFLKALHDVSLITSPCDETILDDK